MAKYIVEASPTLPRDFQPLVDRRLTDELRGLIVRTAAGYVGAVSVVQEKADGVRAFVVFADSSGWFDLDVLIFDEEPPCPNDPITSSATSPTTTSPGSSTTSRTTSSSSGTTSSTSPSCGCASCVASLLAEIKHDR